jgi:hypothetical protein
MENLPSVVSWQMSPKESDNKHHVLIQMMKSLPRTKRLFVFKCFDNGRGVFVPGCSGS